MSLNDFGWNRKLQKSFGDYEQRGLAPARVCAEHRERYRIVSAEGEQWAEVSGKLRHGVRTRADYPAVGDWTAVAASTSDGPAVIHAVLPRRSRIVRKAVRAGGPKYGEGRTEEQVLAANVDTVFLVTGLDQDFNLRRLERYLPMAWDSGADPVILLNKADLCDDPQQALNATRDIAPGVPVYPISAATGESLAVLETFLEPGRTAVLLGSSGVGKTTLINALLGEERLATREVREYDSRGRHTTTHRHLLNLPGGGLIIDTPGLREVRLWESEDGLERTFGDVEELIEQCRFRNCSHQSEPGCAVQAALADGNLDPGRWRNYLKQQKELEHLRLRQDKRAARAAQKEFAKMCAAHIKEMRKTGRKGY